MNKRIPLNQKIISKEMCPDVSCGDGLFDVKTIGLKVVKSLKLSVF